MDTSILGTLFDIAPDLMEEIELRTLVLERVAALGPIGRRALAQRLCLPEREVRSAADALRASGCINQSAAGMELTEIEESTGSLTLTCIVELRTVVALPLLVLVTSQ